MTVFHGAHEIRLFRPDRSIAVGYFDDWDAALRAVENEPLEYTGAYFTLNPLILPPSFVVNPQALSSARNTAGDSDIARRVWLFIDCDPPREVKTNSTAEEKQAAHDEAERIREWLGSHGWPEPVLADSGNGWHLLYRVDLPNTQEITALLVGFLTRLKQLFPMVDLANSNPSRLCKLYGSWARKGEHSDERPWRRSAIVEQGSGVIVTEDQIRALTPVKVTPQKTDDVKLASLLGFLDYYGVALRSEPREVNGGWQIEIECPWADEHSSESRRDTVVSFIAGLGNGFRCFHGHCANRHWRELRAELEKRNPGLAPYYGKLPPMTHSDIARAFVESHDDFVRVYDQDNDTGVWIPGKRWALGDRGDALLRKALRQYVNELHGCYPAPEAGQRDPRRALKQAAFVNGMLSEVKPWLPPKASRDFDANAAILPLPDGKVADLRSGTIREMTREDCQTKRISVTPADVPTPRWHRFLQEISCGDDELAAYIVRLMALALTGLSPHLLVIFYGRGRNGKGVALRLIEKMLGRDLFAAALRPEDVEYKRGADDRDKRLMGRLKGKRLAYTGETVSGNLAWTLLKTLTGGDTLAGADLYKNTESFTPSHTLILTTNDRPKLPPTVAFKERLRFVPFNGDFSKSRDFTVEDDLAREMPGILWQLIKIAPDVFANGDNPPLAVREATDDVMDENDVARPFIDECLIVDPEAVTPLGDIESAVRKWMGLTIDEPRVGRIMEGVRARWNHGRKGPRGKQVRGLIGVRVIVESSVAT
jgi:P4 family phage/plasmid primase-like protien